MDIPQNIWQHRHIPTAASSQLPLILLGTHSKDNKNAQEIDCVRPFSWVTCALNLGLRKGYVIRSYFTSTSLGKSAPTDFLCDLKVVISHYVTYIELSSEH